MLAFLNTDKAAIFGFVWKVFKVFKIIVLGIRKWQI